MSVSIDCMHGLHDACRYTDCRCDCHKAESVGVQLRGDVTAAVTEGMVTEHFAGRIIRLPLSGDCQQGSHASCTYGDDGCACWCHENDEEANFTVDHILWGDR